MSQITDTVYLTIEIRLVLFTMTLIFTVWWWLEPWNGLWLSIHSGNFRKSQLTNSLHHFSVAKNHQLIPSEALVAVGITWWARCVSSPEARSLAFFSFSGWYSCLGNMCISTLYHYISYTIYDICASKDYIYQYKCPYVYIYYHIIILSYYDIIILSHCHIIILYYYLPLVYRYQ